MVRGGWGWKEVQEKRKKDSRTHPTKKTQPPGTGEEREKTHSHPEMNLFKGDIGEQERKKEKEQERKKRREKKDGRKPSSLHSA